ncbi:putative hydro-lyase [Pukyongiella litopenaei]|uniref:Putative hydro-lyase n=1 Tax=Pukyongiella litopenaei TaxID=2605946 RepID=A0A2S0MUU1_9RHOB|nr:putative hydro-lyase [Pukyongiella litopenaei]AVO39664.1 putative hydro-lyase [Pukyongiella litopenaei]
MDSIPLHKRVTHDQLAAMPVGQVRQALRENAYAGHTAGLCNGRLQCNLVILPAADGEDFLGFCEANPVFCPLVGVSQPGRPQIDRLGAEIDLRTDLPLFFVYRPGQAVERRQDIKALWREDLMAFAVGCSFTFEHALMRAGIGMRHVENGVTVPMFRTNIATRPAGRFAGPAVVSMRPIPEGDADRVRDICARFPHAHGAPIHIGNPGDIGIANLNRPDWGEAVRLRDGEVAAFWGCGVTTQVALSGAAPEIAITHAPGAMLITDADETDPNVLIPIESQ